MAIPFKTLSNKWMEDPAFREAYEKATVAQIAAQLADAAKWVDAAERWMSGRMDDEQRQLTERELYAFLGNFTLLGGVLEVSAQTLARAVLEYPDA